VASTSNEAVISGAVNLIDYDTVIWILGEESTADDTFNATEQTKVEQFIAAGGNLFVTGAEIGWDLDQQNNGRAFFENTLKGNYVADGAGTYAVNGIAGSIFAGLSFSFDNGTLFYNAELADVISPQAGAQAALNYANGSGSAGIQVPGSGGRGSVVMFGFPFETITTAANRASVIDRVFDFFGLAAFGPDNADFNGSGLVDTADFVVWRKNNNTSVEPGTHGDANHDGLVSSNDYQIWRAQYGLSLPAASAAMDPSNMHAAVATPSALAISRTRQPSASVEANEHQAVDGWPASAAENGRNNVGRNNIPRRPAVEAPALAQAQSATIGRHALLSALVERELRHDSDAPAGTAAKKLHTRDKTSENHRQPFGFDTGSSTLRMALRNVDST
jgi:hypothetical protein